MTLVDDDLPPRAHPQSAGGPTGRRSPSRSPVVVALPASAPAAPRAPVAVPRPLPRPRPRPRPRHHLRLSRRRGRGGGGRLAMLREAFSEGEASSFAAESTRVFTQAVELAGQPAWVAEPGRSSTPSCKAMRGESRCRRCRAARQVVHELGKLYAIATASYDNEPRRHVDLFRTATPTWPGCPMQPRSRLAAPAASSAGARAAGRRGARKWRSQRRSAR